MTTIQTSIKYDCDSRDFAVIVDDQIVGWRENAAQAESLLNETVTRITALRAQVDTPACRTCGGPVEIDTSVGLFDDECDDCAALACERCGEPVTFDTASILGDEMVCAACYAAQQAHVEAMAALVAADERRAYRESLAVAGSHVDAAAAAIETPCACGATHHRDPHTGRCFDYGREIFWCACGALLTPHLNDDALIERIEDDRAFFVASCDDEPLRTCAAEDRASRGGW